MYRFIFLVLILHGLCSLFCDTVLVEKCKIKSSSLFCGRVITEFIYLFLNMYSVRHKAWSYLSLFFCHALGLVMVKMVGSGSLTIFFWKVSLFGNALVMYQYNTGKWARHRLTMLTCRGAQNWNLNAKIFFTVAWFMFNLEQARQSVQIFYKRRVCIDYYRYFPKSTIVEFKMSTINKRINNYLLRLVNDSVPENRLIYIYPK